MPDHFPDSVLVLWKAAGANACATGKFFNLRRFTRSRFEEPKDGGQQIPYWFEEPLVAFLRDADILRLESKGLLDPRARNNPFSAAILDQLHATPALPWVGLSWRQHLYAFIDLERRLAEKLSDPIELVRRAEQRWLDVEDERIYMDEARNNGKWLRPWLQALVEYET